MTSQVIQGSEQGTYSVLPVLFDENSGLPTGREPDGNGASAVVQGRESRCAQTLGSGRRREAGHHDSHQGSRYARCEPPVVADVS